jgi:hypothetical protein
MTMRRILSNAASSVTKGEKQTHLQENHAHAVSTKEVDTGAQFVAGLSTELDPAEAARVRFAVLASLSSTNLERATGRKSIITSSQ